MDPDGPWNQRTTIQQPPCSGPLFQAGCRQEGSRTQTLNGKHPLVYIYHVRHHDQLSTYPPPITRIQENRNKIERSHHVGCCLLYRAFIPVQQKGLSLRYSPRKSSLSYMFASYPSCFQSSPFYENMHIVQLDMGFEKRYEIIFHYHKVYFTRVQNYHLNRKRIARCLSSMYTA